MSNTTIAIIALVLVGGTLLYLQKVGGLFGTKLGSERAINARRPHSITNDETWAWTDWQGRARHMKVSRVVRVA